MEKFCFACDFKLGHFLFSWVPQALKNLLLRYIFNDEYICWSFFSCPNLGTCDCFENVSSLVIPRVQVDGPINFEGFLSVTQKEIPHQLS